MTWGKNIAFTNGEFGDGTVKFIGEIFPIHPNVKSSQLPNVLFPSNYLLCDGVGSLPTTYFTSTTVPDLSDNRFLQGNTISETAEGNFHNHTWYYNDSTGGTVGETWLSDGNFLQTVESVTPDNYEGQPAAVGHPSERQVFDVAKQGEEYFTEDVDTRPKYFSVKYFIRIS